MNIKKLTVLGMVMITALATTSARSSEETINKTHQSMIGFLATNPSNPEMRAEIQKLVSPLNQVERRVLGQHVLAQAFGEDQPCADVGRETLRFYFRLVGDPNPSVDDYCARSFRQQVALAAQLINGANEILPQLSRLILMNRDATTLTRAMVVLGGLREEESTREGSRVLLQLGFANYMDASVTNQAASELLSGTPPPLPPEILRRIASDPRVDENNRKIARSRLQK